MKLAEALIQRADLQTRQEQLRQRLSVNALVQEGELPSEDPKALLRELSENTEKLGSLISRINITNAETVVSGRTITEMLAERKAVTTQVSIMRSFLDCASQTVMRATRSEVKIKSTVSVSELRKQTDALSEKLRNIDTLIQSANWTVELK